VEIKAKSLLSRSSQTGDRTQNEGYTWSRMGVTAKTWTAEALGPSEHGYVQDPSTELKDG
jgi:hypothetical protein